MGRIEDAIIFATAKHNNQKRKLGHTPYIFHPIEVAAISSELTTDEDTIIASVLHDTLEDTDCTKDELLTAFGERVCNLVSMESENKRPGEKASDTWQARKTETLQKLTANDDLSFHIICLSDKLANLRALTRSYRLEGDCIWSCFNQSDPLLHKQYYGSIINALSPVLHETGAYKELKALYNELWKENCND